MPVHAYVINLPRSTERRVRMEHQLASAGLDYEFVEGVDGRQLSPEAWERLVDAREAARYPDWFGPGMVGCRLSHLRCYELIAASGADAALILEDDARLPAGLDRLVEGLARHLHAGEVMLLNFRSFGPALLRRGDATDCGGHRILDAVRPRQLVSALAYLVGAQTAAAMRASNMPVRWAPDSWGEFVEHGAVNRVRCVLPQPVSQDIDTRSTVSHGANAGLRERIQSSGAAPIHAVRVLNRRRVRRRMTRVKLVD